MGDAEDGQGGADGSSEDAVSDAVINENVEVTTDAEPTDDGFRIKRTAAFAEMADRPKRKAIDSEKEKNDVVFFDDLRKFDAELAGTIYAQCQSAASGMDVVHPAVEGNQKEMSTLEADITEDCRQLIDDLGLKKDGMTIFRNLIVHGNDVSWMGYEDDEGVVEFDALPLRSLTALDYETYRSNATGVNTGVGGEDNFEETITDADVYLINEGHSDHEQVYPAHDILHVALNRRANWHKDLKGRDTFGVWGERRLEPVRYSLQAKQNTLSNKVAMDDKLLAREFYYVNVEELFGHIDDPDRRQEKAEEYADELRSLIENLDADQKPILPEEVTVSIEGPDGETARNMASFIQTMNDSLQHALTYHVASFGRDAGGTDRGNRPAKEMSDNSVRHLRNVVRTAFQRLFEIHAVLRYPEAREVVDADSETIERFAVRPDVTLPVLTFDPVNPQEEAEKVRNSISLYEKGVATLNESRSFVGLEPLDGPEGDELFKKPGAEEEPTEPGDDPDEGPGEETPDDEGDEPGDGPGGNRRSYPTDSHETRDNDDTDVNGDEET